MARLRCNSHCDRNAMCPAKRTPDLPCLGTTFLQFAVIYNSVATVKNANPCLGSVERYALFRYAAKHGWLDTIKTAKGWNEINGVLPTSGEEEPSSTWVYIASICIKTGDHPRQSPISQAYVHAFNVSNHGNKFMFLRIHTSLSH